MSKKIPITFSQGCTSYGVVLVNTSLVASKSTDAEPRDPASTQHAELKMYVYLSDERLSYDFKVWNYLYQVYR